LLSIANFKELARVLVHLNIMGNSWVIISEISTMELSFWTKELSSGTELIWIRAAQ